MRTFHEIDDALARACAGGSTVAIGMFDGVHLGHQRLISTAVEQARSRHLPALVLTFTEHPLSLLAPPYAPQLLCTPEEKAQLIDGLGIEILVMLDFTPHFAATSAHDFIAGVLVDALGSRFISCGPDFRFGANGAGDIALLRSAGRQHGFDVRVAETVQFDGAPVRSTRVRGALLEGDVREAAHLLGRPYRLAGEVVPGDRRGRTIGYPTANIQPPPRRLVPADGVYAVRAHHGEYTHAAMMSIGLRPTFRGRQRTHEVHVFDFDGELYGQTLTVEFIARLRGNRKFDDSDALLAQLRRDESEARKTLERLSPQP